MAADEVVALFDPDDVCGRVVGASRRSEVRARNLPHAATGVLLRRSTGEVFVHRRAATKDLWPSAHDCAAGGVVLAGESVEEAARRELAEEVGVEGADLRELLTAWYRDDDTHYLAHVYEAVWDGPVSFRDDEVAEGWWMRPEELLARLADPSWPFVPDTRWVLGLVGDRLSGDPPAQDVGRPWPGGATVVFRWGREGRTRVARLCRVLRDDADGLLLWVGQGWPAVEQALADGRDVREAPMAERFAAPRLRRTGLWRGPGIVMLVPPGGRAWSLWWFFDDGGAFRGWYGNLEAPHVLHRGPLGAYLVDSADHALDVWVEPDGTSRWKDEDEFDHLTGTGTRWPPSQAPVIRAAGDALRRLAAQGAQPFDGRWTVFSPDPAWPVPAFPPDWDVPHRSGY